MEPKIMLIGGDNTSDRFGSALALEIMKHCPTAQLLGVGGPLMKDAGVSVVYDISDMMSLGVLQSIKGSTVARRLLKRVTETMEKEEPALVVQIGLPVFSFKLLEIARARQIPVLYYYTPFSRGLANANMRQFSAVVSRVASISRSETALCQEAGIDVEFVGHPLRDLMDYATAPQATRAQLGIDSEESKVVAVFPGAREVEVKHVLPTALKSLELLLANHDDVEVMISVAPTISEGLVGEILGDAGGGKIRMVDDDVVLLDVADLAITSIGTKSLEASLLGVPSLAVYRVPCTTYFANKLLDREPYMTITNNILRKTVIPEFIQADFDYPEIAETIEQLLYDEQTRQAMLKELARLEQELGEPGSLERVAEMVLEMVGCEDHATSS